MYIYSHYILASVIIISVIQRCPIMDVVTEELSSPLQGFKYVKPFSNFFQATKQRFANLDPDSGVHMVGPMFELTACIDKGKG